ncbi:MAG TPA: alpha-1,2-fucosyltransferase [Cytophagaceae bacterium]|jgi:hypothetical protein|nr:alpha-1,2-fucosyltransferase [Cytophagaceae bacterium]
MIVVKLSGGLGNQMFQYACGRFLSEIKHTDLQLDVKSFQDKSSNPDLTYRDYQLRIFNIDEKLASEKDVQSFIKPKSFLKKIIFKIRQKSRGKIIATDSNYDLNILDKESDIYLDGYFQNEKYFIGIKDILSKEFSLKDRLNASYSEMQNQISICNSVSIHIRRGDYVNNSVTNNYHGVCGLDYYKKAMSVIAEKVTEPRFFIFSDDVNWVRENLKSQWPLTFVSGGKSFEDLFLMSQCKHNIIANSSFSWWAGWLNKYPEKIVVGPLKWFNDPKINAGFNLPEKWIRV